MLLRKSMKFIVQLEPLEARYTAQWARWIPEALEAEGFKNGRDTIYVDWEKLTDEIEVGDVLDVYGTHYWKFDQLKAIMALFHLWEVKDWDEFWFADLWFPGIEALAYVRSMTGIKFKITGVLHAGTWDKKDFTYRNWMHQWAKGFEKTLFDIVDEVHLGSTFHKQIILADLATLYSIEYSRDIAKKLKITGLFFDASEVQKYSAGIQKEKGMVVFPHRLAPEKQPEMFDKIAALVPEMKFIKTMEVTKGKKEYYELLAKAEYSISFEWQETFGYSTLESMALGVKTLVFNGMSYTDTVPEILRWNTQKELVEKLKNWVSISQEELSQAASKYMPREIIIKMFK